MANHATVWIVPDVNAFNVDSLHAGMQTGDMIYRFSDNTLWVQHPTGAQPVGIALATAGAAGAVKKAAATPALTDNSGGTVSSTLAAITAGSTYAQADMVAAKNAIASLNAQINSLVSHLQAAGISA